MLPDVKIAALVGRMSPPSNAVYPQSIAAPFAAHHGIRLSPLLSEPQTRCRAGNWRWWLPALAALIFLFTACSQDTPPTPAPAATSLPPIALVGRSGSVTASGKVAPARSADLSFPIAGRVDSVAVEVGQPVEAGDALIALDAIAAETAVVQARTALFRAQAHLAELQAGALPLEIEVAQARLDAAQARLSQLVEGALPAEINAARADLAAAQAGLQQLYNGPREEERIAGLVALSNAKAALQQAQSAYNQVSWRGDVGMLPESRQLQEATNNYEAAQARYDALYAQPSADLTATGSARVQQAQAALGRLQQPASPGQIAEVEAQVRSAQAEFDLLTEGARAETIAVAAVAVTDAEALLQRATADLANTELTAPFGGVVAALKVDAGEMVAPAQVVVTVADLDNLQVETTDLSERDVARIAEGQAANVLIEPLDEEVSGRVVRIAPQANVIGGDVVYEVVIALDQQPANLRWGMSAEVEILGE